MSKVNAFLTSVSSKNHPHSSIYERIADEPSQIINSSEPFKSDLPNIVKTSIAYGILSEQESKRSPSIFSPFEYTTKSSVIRDVPEKRRSAYRLFDSDVETIPFDKEKIASESSVNQDEAYIILTSFIFGALIEDRESRKDFSNSGQ